MKDILSEAYNANGTATQNHFQFKYILDDYKPERTLSYRLKLKEYITADSGAEYPDNQSSGYLFTDV